VSDVLADLGDIFDGFPVEHILRVLVVLISSVVVQLIGNRAIHRTVTQIAKRAPHRRPGQLRGADDTELAQQLMEDRQRQRAHALGSLAKSALTIFIWGVAIITILAIMGINVAPLLASAGVATAVIGFGAQQYIADYLAGISMIFEDQLGIGDTVNLGGTVLGEVEETALRYTRVRDYWGAVWYVRNGTINYVQNQSQGWLYALVEIPVPYDTDLSKVEQVVNDAGKVMGQDPQYNGILLGAPVYSAIEALTPTSAVVRINTKIVPNGNQWYAARVIRQEMKRALDEAGIHIPLDGIQVRTVPVAAEVVNTSGGKGPAAPPAATDDSSASPPLSPRDSSAPHGP